MCGSNQSKDQQIDDPLKKILREEKRKKEEANSGEGRGEAENEGEGEEVYNGDLEKPSGEEMRRMMDPRKDGVYGPPRMAPENLGLFRGLENSDKMSNKV